MCHVPTLNPFRAARTDNFDQYFRLVFEPLLDFHHGTHAIEIQDETFESVCSGAGVQIQVCPPPSSSNVLEMCLKCARRQHPP